MAANGINVKMGVEGLSQFKNNMKTAQTAVKTLDQQLKTNEAQFKATGDAEAYMEQKTQLLELKLKEQKTTVTNAEKALEAMREKGIDPANASYQKLAQEMLKAKAGMYETEAALNEVGEAGDLAADGVSEMNNQLKRVGDGVNWQNVTDSLDRISDGIGHVIQRAWKMGEALVQNVLGAGSWADELKTTADQYQDTLYVMSGGGSGTEYLQRMRYTANQIDTDVDTILSSIDKLKKGSEEANKDTMGAFAYLGVDPTGKNIADVFWEAGEAIANLGEQEDKNHYAQALFGRSWRELTPLFKAGRQEYEETMASWNVVSDETIENLGKMDDQYNALNSEWETFRNEMLGAFAGPLTLGMEKLTGFVEKLNEYLSSPDGQAMLKQMGDTVTQLIDDLTNVNPEDIVNGLSSVVDGIKNGLQWIDEHSGTVVGAIEAIIGAWGLTKVAAGITTFLKLIGAIQGLTASQAAAAGASVGGSWATAFWSAATKAVPILAGLAVLMENAFKPQGNDDIWDENGNLTDMGKSVVDENGNVKMIAPTQMHGRFNQDQYDLLQDYWDKYRSGTASAEDWATLQAEFGKSEAYMEKFLDIAREIYSLDKTMEDLPETLFADNESINKSTSEMTEAANGMKGLPAQIESAVERGMSRVKLVVDVDGIANAVTPRISSNIAAGVKSLYS